MNKDEARKILSAYRPADEGGATFTEALQEIERDPELSRWWAEEQVFDQAIATKVQTMPVPPELKSRLLQSRGPVPHDQGWGRKITLLAATLVVGAILFSSARGIFQPEDSLANYRDEMVSFVRLTPPLEMKSSELSQLLSQMQKNGMRPTDISLPPRLRELGSIGCRALRFRGHDVTLLCFKRADGRWVHLFILRGMALPGLSHIPDQTYATESDWMTAAWSDGGNTYLLALQGGREAVEKYF